MQFELKNSYEELRTQLEEWEEDKQWWKAREESNRRMNVEPPNLSTIPEEDEDFENLATQNEVTDLATQNEVTDLISNSPLELTNLQNFEQAEDQISFQNRKY